jgi:hypothetical protein
MKTFFDEYAFGCIAFAILCGLVDFYLSKQTKDRIRTKLGDWWLHLKYYDIEIIWRNCIEASRYIFGLLLNWYSINRNVWFVYFMTGLLSLAIVVSFVGLSYRDDAIIVFAVTWAFLT